MPHAFAGDDFGAEFVGVGEGLDLPVSIECEDEKDRQRDKSAEIENQFGRFPVHELWPWINSSQSVCKRFFMTM
jgi:hypothetical protein